MDQIYGLYKNKIGESRKIERKKNKTTWKVIKETSLWWQKKKYIYAVQ